MSTNLKLLNQNNKKIYGGGNVKQGLVPSGTKFFGMRLKTNLNRARNGADTCKAYDGVCFEQFDRSAICINTNNFYITGGTTETTKGGYKYHTFSVAGTHSFSVSVSGNCSTKTPIPRTFTFEYIVVGGGGKGGRTSSSAGSRGYAGGGGGGGVLEGTLAVTTGTFIVIVGGGGTAAGSGAGDDGEKSSFTGNGIASPPEADGGKGGNDGKELQAKGGDSGDPTLNPGGLPETLPPGRSAGGGGGAGANGGDGSLNNGGTGGASYSATNSWNPVGSLPPNYGYGGGGGAGSTGAGQGGGEGGAGTGGSGTGGTGDGDGDDAASGVVGENIYAGGGGGGGASRDIHDTSSGGNGATGIVIIRYPA